MRYFFFTTFILFTMIISGCMGQQTSEQSNEQIPLTNKLSQTNDAPLSNNEIASHLANIASDVPHVNDAVAIIAGPYAVVGIDIDEQAKRQEVGSIKYSVSEALRDDPYGKTAVVIADGDIVERLREMRAHIQDGEPASGIAEELAGIVSRYMPIFPVPDVQPKESTDDVEQLREEDENELRDIQKEQANDK